MGSDPGAGESRSLAFLTIVGDAIGQLLYRGQHDLDEVTLFKIEFFDFSSWNRHPAVGLYLAGEDGVTLQKPLDEDPAAVLHAGQVRCMAYEKAERFIRDTVDERCECTFVVGRVRGHINPISGRYINFGYIWY